MKYVFLVIFTYLDSLMDSLLRLSIILILLFMFCHKIGFVTRCIHKFAEYELKKICNGANVTIGKIEVDIIHGHATAMDLVIHSPHKEEWAWDSPLIVRVGKIHAHFNLMTLVDPLAFYFKTWPFRDIYGGVVEDIQVFIEKRRNIFNFHLLDPSLDIPNAKDVLKFYERQEEEEAKLEEVIAAERNIEGLDESIATASCSDGTIPMHASTSAHSFLETSPSCEETAVLNAALRENADAEKKANEIVTSMLGAVSSLGRAANEGGKEGFSQAIRSRTETLVKNLKQLQTSKTKSPKQAPAENNHSNRSSVQSIAKESLQVIKNMQKAVERNVEEIKQQVDVFTKPPPKKADWKKPRMDSIRIGYLIGKDIRIFTKGVILSSNKNLNPNSISKSANWSKPIYLKELSLTAAELAPPITSSRDEVTGLPPIGMTPDRIVDTVLKKALAEMAKTNAGRVLETAFSEVFAWMDKK